MARTSFALIESFLIDPLGWVMISILLRDLYKYLCLFHFSMCDTLSVQSPLDQRYNVFRIQSKWKSFLILILILILRSSRSREANSMRGEDRIKSGRQTSNWLRAANFVRLLGRSLDVAPKLNSQKCFSYHAIHKKAQGSYGQCLTSNWLWAANFVRPLGWWLLDGALKLNN